MPLIFTELLKRRDMFGNFELEQEQEKLLMAFVEAYRNVPLNLRRPFQMITSDETYFAEIRHLGLPDRKISAYEADIKTLARDGLLDISYSLHGVIYGFDITPEGFAYYRQIKQRDNEPIMRVEDNLRNYLQADRFQQKYAKAYQKWKDAEAMLWDSDSERQLTTIGHLCREAIQEFATSLVEYYQPVAVDPNKAHDIARISAVINLQADKLGDREKDFLLALIPYWRTVSGLIQRQEHGTQKQHQPLVWEDGRRIIFQTAIVMYEVDNSLSKAG